MKRLPLVRPCDVSWDSMSGPDFARRCAQCDRYVHNLSMMSTTEADRLLDGGNGERICITFSRGPDGQVITRDRPARFALRRLTGASGIAAATALTMTLAPDVSAARSTIDATYQQLLTKPASKQPRGGLRGRVVMAVTDTPVEGASILARNIRSGEEFKTQSANDGRYELRLSKGRYLVQIDAREPFYVCEAKNVDVGNRLLNADVNVSIPPIGEWTGWDFCGNKKFRGIWPRSDAAR